MEPGSGCWGATTADRIAQTAAAMLLEEKLERSSITTVMAIVPGAVPMTLWPWPVSAVGSRTGCSTSTSGLLRQRAP